MEMSEHSYHMYITIYAGGDERRTFFVKRATHTFAPAQLIFLKQQENSGYKRLCLHSQQKDSQQPSRQTSQN